MLFVLAFIPDTSQEDILELSYRLGKFLDAHHDSRHFVVIPPSISVGGDVLGACSLTQRATYNRIRSEWAFDGSTCVRGAQCIAWVTLDGVVPSGSLRNLAGRSDCDHFGVRWALSSKFVEQQAVLLCENHTDAVLLQRMAGWAKSKWYNLRGMQLSIDARGGGGSQLATEYEETLMNKKCTLAVADSDQTRPMGALGNTAKTAKRAHTACLAREREKGEIGSIIGLVYVLRVRSFENMIHPRLYCSVAAGEKTSRERMLAARLWCGLWYSDDESRKYAAVKGAAEEYNTSGVAPCSSLECPLARRMERLTASGVPDSYEDSYLATVQPGKASLGDNVLADLVSVADDGFRNLAACDLPELNELLEQVVYWGFAASPRKLN